MKRNYLERPWRRRAERIGTLILCAILITALGFGMGYAAQRVAEDIGARIARTVIEARYQFPVPAPQGPT